MHIKVHQSYRKVVAICDSDILGKKYEEGIKQLDLREDFFKGEEVDEDKLISLMKKYKLDDATFNIVGEKSISAALKAELISVESIGKIANIPYALVLI